MKQMHRYYYFVVTVLLGALFSNTSKDIEEYNAKALFIYNFTKYIDWEDLTDKENFTIGVTKKCEITSALKIVSGAKKIQDKKIQIVEFKENNPNVNCQILFFPENTSKEQYLTVANSISRKNVLLISESKKLFDCGTDINFILQDEKIKFEINLSSIENAGLKISSQLLKLATRVKKQ